MTMLPAATSPRSTQNVTGFSERVIVLDTDQVLPLLMAATIVSMSTAAKRNRTQGWAANSSSVKIHLGKTP